jgi:hypothetical protein
MSDKDELAALKKKVEELETALSGKEDKPPKSTFVPMTDAEHRNWVYQMQERRMSMAMPPSVHHYFADGVTAADCADLRQQARRPSGRPGMIPEQPSSGGERPAKSAGDGTGWRAATPLGPPPGVAQADKLMDEQDRRDRIELARRLGKG